MRRSPSMLAWFLVWAATSAGRLAMLAVRASGFFYTTGKPRHWLPSAVQNTSNTKTPVKFDDLNSDDIGQVYKAFNEMQQALQRENKRFIETNFELAQREEQLTIQNARFSAALENMPHGLAMFDAEQRLIICNSNFATMYDLDCDLTKTGTTLRSILEARVTNKTMPKDTADYVDSTVAAASRNEASAVERELTDGRIVSVTRQPMSGGGWVSIHMDVTEKRSAEKRLAFLAHHDALTGLANRVQLRECIENNLIRANRGQCFVVLGLDLDYFKRVNDTMGHSSGDAVLCMVSQRLRECLRSADLIARTGGDEFAIVLSDIEFPMIASTTLAERIIAVMSRPFNLGDHQVVVGTSIGITIAPQDGDDPDQLLKNADMAMYRAKAEGRGMFHFFEAEMDNKAQARRNLEIDLRHAVSAKEFELYFQPIIDISQQKVIRFEALLRWNHPVHGRILPDRFIPLAEETGLIVPIGEWVIRQACAEAKKWPAHLRVAVNVSPVQLRNRNLVSAVAVALADSGLPSNQLELEITEAVLLQNNVMTLEILHQLRNLGISISIDDFGTGHSSLSYLRSFPFDKIKIDRSFVQDIMSKPDSIAIIRAVAGLGRNFGMMITVEGLETKDQLEKIRAEGCTEVQGYLFSKPQPASEVPRLLSSLENGSQAAA